MAFFLLNLVQSDDKVAVYSLCLFYNGFDKPVKMLIAQIVSAHDEIVFQT